MVLLHNVVVSLLDDTPVCPWGLWHEGDSECESEAVTDGRNQGEETAGIKGGKAEVWRYCLREVMMYDAAPFIGAPEVARITW